jgi:hypothetical protein
METEIDIVKHWIEKVVIGLNFCPFAAKPFNLDKIIYLVHNEEDISLYVKQLYAVLRELQEEPAEVLETAFIIYPHSFQDFKEYLNYLNLLNDFLEMNHLEKEFQLASFHPSYQFMGSSTDDVTNYTNKSPFPVIHILRSDSILKARLTYPDTLKIPQINIDKLKLLGIDGWIAFCKENQLSILL